jgi:hypothetical protein
MVDKSNDSYFLQGLPQFVETKMFGVNISKYKKQDNNSSKKQNTILFDVNSSKKYSYLLDPNISISPVVLDVNVSKKYSKLSDKNISKKYPDLFDVNVSTNYPLVVDTNISKEYPFVFDANISKYYNEFHERRIIYLNMVIRKINDENKLTDKLVKLRNSSCEHVKNRACMYIKRESKNSEDENYSLRTDKDKEKNDACRSEIKDIIIKNKTSKSKTEMAPEDKYKELMTICDDDNFIKIKGCLIYN